MEDVEELNVMNIGACTDGTVIPKLICKEAL
jgi:hypothetical protein